MAKYLRITEEDLPLGLIEEANAMGEDPMSLFERKLDQFIEEYAEAGDTHEEALTYATYEYVDDIAFVDDSPDKMDPEEPGRFDLREHTKTNGGDETTESETFADGQEDPDEQVRFDLRESTR